ncbi:MAG: helix-turn-helix domain-containing protein [Rhodospirillaceae bacterium]|nr:helix-turn-helix domain-containing protein [Rhodospirillaceae bacterium]
MPDIQGQITGPKAFAEPKPVRRTRPPAAAPREASRKPISDLSISKSVGRAFIILEHFRGARAPCSTGELQKALNYPYSSVRAILKSLNELGYLRYFEAERTYFPTQKLMRLGNWIQNALMQSEGLIDLVDAVYHQVNETVALATRNFVFCNFLQVRNSKQRLSVQFHSGICLMLANTVAGRVILSQLEDKETARILDHTRNWASYAKAGPVANDGDIRGAIESCRKNGFIVDYDVGQEGAGTVCVPVPSPFPSFPLAILVTGPSTRIRHHAGAIRQSIESCIALTRKWA